MWSLQALHYSTRYQGWTAKARPEKALALIGLYLLQWQSHEPTNSWRVGARFQFTFTVPEVKHNTSHRVSLKELNSHANT